VRAPNRQLGSNLHGQARNAYWRIEINSDGLCSDEAVSKYRRWWPRQARRPQPIAAPFPAGRNVELPPGHYSSTQKDEGLPGRRQKRD
jgi:hypothetical protein